jgi:hypothetical protein
VGELLALEDEREVQMRREFGPEWELLASDGAATITAIRAVLSASEDKVACAARLYADVASGFAEAATGESSVCLIASLIRWIASLIRWIRRGGHW